MEPVELAAAPTVAHASVVRASMAALLLGGKQATGTQLGSIELQPHQLSAVARVRNAIAEFGGALLCDPVGTGKTYVALAVPPEGNRVLVVAPAVLKDMWTRAAQLADRPVAFASFESLSRGRCPGGEFEFVIVDEAHHARNPRTHRYESLSRLSSRSEVVLLTATPIHNRRGDLIALLSLFLGERAAGLSSAEIARCVIRRGEIARAIAGIPLTDSLVWCTIREASRIPGVILSLPPPVPPRDGGDGGALVMHSLIRQWASSDAALIGGLRRRLVRAEALIAALEDGTWPSGRELESWVAGEDAIQLSFSSMLAPRAGATGALLTAIREHRDGVRELLSLSRASGADAERAGLVQRIRESHSPTRVVAFSQYSDTVNGMFALLSRHGEAAALTGDGARVAGGALSRADAIARFAPVAAGTSVPRAADNVTLLITTDLLSEGVNLQDAGVVIHLDLPWTPAKMEQRLGRIARIGSRHERVASYALTPPTASREIVRIEAILRKKMSEAAIVSNDFRSLRAWAPDVSENSTPELAESIRCVLERWAGDGPLVNASPLVCAVQAGITGFISVCVGKSGPFLVASAGGRITDDPQATSKLISLSECESATPSSAQVHSALRSLTTWLYSRGATSQVVALPAGSGGVRRQALRRVDRAVRAGRPHARAKAGDLARKARALLLGGSSVHAEREIASLMTAHDTDAAFLHAIASLEPRHLTESLTDDDDTVRISTLVLFVK